MFSVFNIGCIIARLSTDGRDSVEKERVVMQERQDLWDIWSYPKCPLDIRSMPKGP